MALELCLLKCFFVFVFNNINNFRIFASAMEERKEK